MATTVSGGAGAGDGGDPAKIRLGSCPDSWGVWFADDPAQTPWPRFLDELPPLPATSGLNLARTATSRPTRSSSGKKRAARPQGFGGWCFRGPPSGRQVGGGPGGRPQGCLPRPGDGRSLFDLSSRALPRSRTATSSTHQNWTTTTGTASSHAGVGGRQDRQGRVRGVAGVPPPRRQPRRYSTTGGTLPRRHRHVRRVPVPGYRPHCLLRRRQPGVDRALR